MIREAIERNRKGTKYPVLTIETTSPLPSEHIFDFILRTDRTTCGNGSSNINGITGMFDALSGMYDLRKDIIQKSGVDLFKLKEWQKHDLNSFINKAIMLELTNNKSLPFYFESLFNCSIETTTLVNTISGHVKGELYCGSYPSSDSIFSDLEILSSIPFLDAVVRFWDMPEKIKANESQDLLENLVSIKISNGSMSLIEPDGKKVKNFICSELYGSKKLRPEMTMPMAKFKEYCSFVRMSLSKIDPSSIAKLVQESVKGK